MKNCGFHFNTTYTKLPKLFFTKLKPETAPSPRVILINEAVAESMGLDLSHLNKKEQADLFSGNRLPNGATPFSQAYAGHQFGHFTILGDGRAHVWGEHIMPNKDRLDIQFKGSGKTPYSRRGDGKAVLGPMLREYIISEAIHYLGIPSTRSLAVATTGENIMRDTLLPGAILTRVSSSHIRVGTFQFAAIQEDKKILRSLMEYTIERHYPKLMESQNKALDLIKAVMERQAELVVHWMRVGFIHGVMNTDNMALSGETIDYGPCAFMDAYNPETVFSSIDEMGRYAYGSQPQITQWNIARFAETLLPLIDDDIDQAVELAEEIINRFPKIYEVKWLAMMCAKLGLLFPKKEDEQLACDLLDWMERNHADYTNTFLDLSKTDKPKDKLYHQKEFEDWYMRWQDRLKENKQSLKDTQNLMTASNPAVIPRNHKVEQALKAAYKDNFKPLKDLLEAIKAPYKDRASLKLFQAPPKISERVYQTFCGT